MAKQKTVYVCRDCGGHSPRWMGRCPSCGEWNTLEEERSSPRRDAVKAAGGTMQAGASTAVRIGDVGAERADHRPTGIAELDRVLGGGIVRGGVYLVGGDPGIGKSTLMMQTLSAAVGQGASALYVTGEESAAQVAHRARRLDAPHANDVHILATTSLEDVTTQLAEVKPHVVVLDSVQTVRSDALDSAAGSVAQVREIAGKLVEVAKLTGMSLFLIGHVTKEGALAGPKVLEHLVDTVLSFEGDSTRSFRLLRAQKNRFGSADEVGVFEMARDGLRPVEDPSALFLAERPANAAGSIVVPTAEGNRPLLVEVQALVAPAVYGAARRVVSGIDTNRLAILLAVLDRKAEIHVLDRDVFASVAGGARVGERALDLALAVAVVSSLRERPVPQDLVMFGEVGLAGEVRAVPRAGARLMEAHKLGFTHAVLPKGCRDAVKELSKDVRSALRLTFVDRLEQALEAALD